MLLLGTLNADRITTNSLDVGGVAVIAGSIGKIQGTTGENETDNGQDIQCEVVRSLYGANSFPKHIAEKLQQLQVLPSQ